MTKDPDAYRDAPSGRFVTEETAQENPEQTVPVTFPIATVWVLSWTDSSDRSDVDSVYADEDVARERLAYLEDAQEARVRVRQAAGYATVRQVWYTLAPYEIVRRVDPKDLDPLPEPVPVETL